MTDKPFEDESDLDSFLKGETEQADPVAESVDTVEAAEPTPEPAKEAKAEEPDEDVVHEPGATVPVGVLVAQRRDWKEKALRSEGEITALKAQLIEATKAPTQAAAPTAADRVPSAIEDPEGNAAYWDQKIFNERLNMSEAILREQHAPADVEAALDAFKKAAKDNPTFASQIRNQMHPYKWAFDQGKRLQAMEEIGADPQAYRAKVEADLRTKLEADIRAEIEGAAPRTITAPVTLPQSLASTRSAQARSAPAFTGPPPLEALFDR